MSENSNGAANGVETTQPLEKKIIRQVEYYFGDFNMPRDKFLKEAVKEDDGWVTMATLLKFKRLADLSKEENVILTALKKSKTGLLEITGEGAEGKIRRSPSQPVPENTEEAKKDLEARTVYLKGFDKESTTLDELLEHFDDKYENVTNIMMRNFFDKVKKERFFKGSVFMTFSTLESAQKFMDLEEVKYKDETLIRKFQRAYLDEKSKEIDEKKKKRLEEKEKVKAAKQKAKGEEEDKEFTLPKGATLKLEGLGGDITREDIKDKLAADFGVNIDRDNGDVAFVVYQKGEEEAKVRFKVEDAAKPIAEKWAQKEKVEIKDKTVTASVLEGEEEDKFLAESVQDLKNRRNKNKAGKGHKRRGGFQGGHGGKRGRRN